MKISIYKIILSALVISLMISAFSSCSDDNFVTTDVVDIEVSDPDTVEYTYVSGLVTDKSGNSLANVSIQYLSDGEIKTTTTNGNGEYEIAELSQDVTRAKIKCQGEGFIPKVEVIHINDDRTVENNIILATTEQTSGITSGQQGNQSLTDSLVSLSGRVINSSGEPVAGIIIYLIDINFTTWLYGVTDSNGQYNFATEPLGPAVLLAGSECESVEALAELVSLEEDTELEDLTTTIIPSTFVAISGFITDCFTGEGLTTGEIAFSYEGENKVTRADIVDGNYSVNIPLCLDVECLQAIVYPFLAQSGTAEIECITYELATSNTFDYEICTEQTVTSNDGALTYNVDGQTYEHPLVGVETNANYYEITALNLESASAQAPNAIIMQTESLEDAGTFKAVFIGNLAIQTAFYNAEPGAISYQIDSTSNGFMYGSFTGNITNLSSGQSTAIDGSFKAAQ